MCFVVPTIDVSNSQNYNKLLRAFKKFSKYNEAFSTIRTHEINDKMMDNKFNYLVDEITSLKTMKENFNKVNKFYNELNVSHSSLKLKNISLKTKVGVFGK